MKKIIKSAFLLVFICILFFAGKTVFDGYNLYQEAKLEKPMAATFSKIERKEDFTSLEELPTLYLEAVVSVEDKRFFDHKGFDIISTSSAFFDDLLTLSFGKGGSTITQQLAKNTFFSQEKKLDRKVAEVFMAKDIERHYSKGEILELYVNSIYFGDEHYGIAAASEGYYLRRPIDLTDYQATLLAGVPNAPAIYAPTASIEMAHKRQKIVLVSLLRDGKITKEDFDSILSEATVA